LSISFLSPHLYNPAASISAASSSSKGSSDTIPSGFYDDLEADSDIPELEAHEGIPVHANASPITLRRRANATLLMLARNSDVDGAVRSVREVEDRFNRKYSYPWVFLNEQPFSDEFIRCAPSHFVFRVRVLV
jgi:alpha 1,2-mannosyltransferase